MSLKNKVCIVTGAGKGIGKSIAIAMAEQGATVAIVDIDEANAKKVADEIIAMGMDSMAIKTDVSNVQQLRDMADAVGEKYGRIDVLVNNAGIIDKTPFDQLEEEEWDRVMNVNVKSAFFASQAVLKYMTKQRSGKIINIASFAGRAGGYSVGCAYSTSKGAVIGLTKSLTRKVAGYNIHVNTVAPGPIESDIGLSPEDYEFLKSNILLGRVGKPKNVADAVIFLAGDTSDFITGATIDVNGGMYIGS